MTETHYISYRSCSMPYITKEQKKNDTTISAYRENHGLSMTIYTGRTIAFQRPFIRQKIKKYNKSGQTRQTYSNYTEHDTAIQHASGMLPLFIFAAHAPQ